MSTDLYRTQSDYNGFLREATGGNLTIGRYLTPDYDLIASGTFTYEYINVEPGRGIQSVPLAGIFQSGSTRSVRGSLTWDRRNNRIFPSAGFQLFGSAEIAPGFILGSDFQYARYSGYWRQYIPLPAGMVFKWNMNAGYIMPLNASRPLPISEHYFLGGINSLRGYNLFSISPTRRVTRTLSPDGDLYRDQFTGDYAVGGNKQFFTNVELEFPILEAAGLRGLLFYDVGNTFAVDEHFFEDKQDRLPLGLFHSVGAGVRWFSPVGPLRFEWGFPLNRRPAIDEPVKFEFNIGNFF